MTDPSSTPKQQGSVAARAGLIAPVIGIAVMVILALAVDALIGVVVGAVVMVALVPILIRVLNRRRPPD